MKLFNSIKCEKSSGPDTSGNKDLTIGLIMTAKCLKAIFNASLPNSELPSYRKLAQLHKKGPRPNLTMTDPFLLQVYLASYRNTSPII